MRGSGAGRGYPNWGKRLLGLVTLHPSVTGFQLLQERGAQPCIRQLRLAKSSSLGGTQLWQPTLLAAVGVRVVWNSIPYDNPARFSYCGVKTLSMDYFLSIKTWTCYPDPTLLLALLSDLIFVDSLSLPFILPNLKHTFPWQKITWLESLLSIRHCAWYALFQTVTFISVLFQNLLNTEFYLFVLPFYFWDIHKIVLKLSF